MRRRTSLIAAAAIAALGAGTAGGIAVANTGGDDAAPITGTALDRASRVALAHTGGGRVTGTEAGDEESLYEVEVTRADGTQVDVQLDERFRVVGSKSDKESAGEPEGAGARD